MLRTLALGVDITFYMTPAVGFGVLAGFWEICPDSLGSVNSLVLDSAM